MALFAGIVLMILISSDVSFGQRKHGRNLPVGADVKTSLNFNCPDEFGYYPHPSDCTQYYVCVFGGALLESCTGGLMYSHELQTCDWPRNVGCDGTVEVATTAAVTYSSSSSRITEPKIRYTHPPPPPPPAQPSAVVTSRGQPRQLHHNQHDIIKQKQQQQQQLYEDAEEALPAAEEIENDRQQRVYRGQPSTVGQVQRDRDGLRHHTNAIPSSSGRGEKIGVISFGTQQQQSQQQPVQQYRDLTDNNDFLTNSLTTMNTRFKRQIIQSNSAIADFSMNHDVISDSRLHITNPKHSTYQRPVSLYLQSPALDKSYSNNYQSYFIQNKHPPYENLQSITFAPIIYNRIRTIYEHPKTVNPFASKLLHNGNYQYFNIKPHPSTVLGELKTSFRNNSYYPYDGSNFNRYSQTTSDNRDNLKYFAPSSEIAYNSDNFKMHYYPKQSFYSTTTIQPNTHLHVTTENFQDFRSITTNFYNMQHYNHAHPQNQHNKQVQQGEENNKADVTVQNVSNLKPVPKNKNFNNPAYKNQTKLFSNIDHDELVGQIIFNTMKNNKSVVVNPELLLLTKLKNANGTYFDNNDDDSYYYYYEDEDSGGKFKNTQSSINKSPTILSRNKSYHDEYDYKEPNTTDYYYEDLNITVQNTSNNINKMRKSPARTIKIPTKFPIQQTIYSSPKNHRVNEELTTVSSTIAHVSTGRSISTAHHRHKLKTTTLGYQNNDYSSQRHNLSNRFASRTVEEPLSTTAAPKLVSNNSQHYDSRYDPYYSLYEDDVELYKDDELAQQYNEPPAPQQTYKSSTSSPTSHVQDKSSKRGHVAYVQNSYTTPQEVYQSSGIQNYDDNNFNYQEDERNAYHQSSKQNSRGDRNELNYIEDSGTIKRITTTTTATTTTMTPRQFPTQKSSRIPSRLPKSSSAQSTHYTLLNGPGNFQAILIQNDTQKPLPSLLDNLPLQNANVNQSALLNSYKQLTTPKSPHFHYITKVSKSTPIVSTIPILDYPNSENENSKVIIPTTYSPPILLLQSVLNNKLNLPIFKPKKIDDSSVSQRSFRVRNQSISPGPKLIYNPPIINNQLQNSLNNKTDTLEIKEINTVSRAYTDNTNMDTKFRSNADFLNKNNPSVINSISKNDLANIASYKIAGQTTTLLNNVNVMKNATTIDRESVSFPVSDDSTTVPSKSFRLDTNVTNSAWSMLLERLNNINTNNAVSYLNDSQDTTIESILPKTLKGILALENQDSYMPNPLEDVTKSIISDASRNTSLPTRVSRVNAAIKSIIALGGQQRQFTKCNSDEIPIAKCKKINQRTNNNRGRGSAHYSSSGPAEAVVVNRGTPAARSRPTLKPSTSIVSKASEYIDIYKYIPQRPPTIYPQPQPDKTAAKCRKDVCLLPDCSCGGKEIPGNLETENTPQMVLMTFDDAVNDLNMGYYAELFQNGRVNPNGCPIVATFYVSHEWTDYSQLQNLYADGHEMASHTVSHSFGEQFSQKKWTKEVAGQREILSAYGGVRLDDVRGMRAPFLSVGGNKMFKMLYDSNFTYDSSMPIYENKPPSWPYTLDYKLFHDCMIPPCPTRSYPGVWEVPMVMWQDLNGGRCSMADACSNPPDADGVFKMLMKNFDRHYTSNRAPFGLFYHAAWFTQPHHKEGFIQFLDAINSMKDVWLVTNWQAIQWVRDPTPVSRLSSFQPFGCNYPERPKRCNSPKVCNLWHKTGVRYMRTCQPCPDIYPWTGNTGIRSSRIDNELEE